MNQLKNETIKELKFDSISEIELTNIDCVEFIESNTYLVKLTGEKEQLEKVIISRENNDEKLKIEMPKTDGQQHSSFKLVLFGTNIKSTILNSIGIAKLNGCFEKERSKFFIENIGNLVANLEINTIKGKIKSVGKVRLSGKVKNGKLKIINVASIDTNSFDIGHVKLSKKNIPFSY
jgi:hypothetical protein